MLRRLIGTERAMTETTTMKGFRAVPTTAAVAGETFSTNRYAHADCTYWLSPPTRSASVTAWPPVPCTRRSAVMLGAPPSSLGGNAPTRTPSHSGSRRATHPHATVRLSVSGGSAGVRSLPLPRPSACACRRSRRSRPDAAARKMLFM